MRTCPSGAPEPPRSVFSQKGDGPVKPGARRRPGLAGRVGVAGRAAQSEAVWAALATDFVSSKIRLRTWGSAIR
jgi:hypothetical protein